ncbi:MAG: flagellar export chaperone FlgN [Synergistaceae bacterium]|nr:flagellar export chaperone FlgN [Synergistaceae bacterium]
MPSDLRAKAKELLARELELCRTLRAMASRELEAIVLDADMDALLKILNEKDAVISQLQLLTDAWGDLLAGGVAPEGPSNVEGRVVALFPDDEELLDMLDDARALADGIMKVEGEAQVALEERSAALRDEMTSLLNGRKAAASYVKMGGSTL